MSGASFLEELKKQNSNTINTPDLQGNTFCHKAVLYQYPAAILAIKSIGGDVNIKDVRNNTPLFIAACQQVSPDCVLALLQAGADRSTAEISKISSAINNIKPADGEKYRNAVKIKEILKIR